MKRIVSVVGVVSGLVYLFAQGAAWGAESGIDIQRSTDRISMQQNGHQIWTFHHRAEEGKPYVHPLATTDGRVFSDLRPDDHPWHRGLWFSWKFINGVNYWEEDRETGTSEGRTLLLKVERSVSPGNETQIKMGIAYAPAATGKRVLNEDRTVVIHPPDAAGAYRIDWGSTFQALDEDVVLDRTPIPGEPGEKSWGGYAGYSLRMNRDVSGGSFTNSEGQIGVNTHRQPARWMAYSDPRDGSVLFLDHPDNIRHPAKWFVADDMPFFSPAVIHDAKHTVKAGTSLTLRYRLVIRPAAFDTQSAEREWGQWISTN